MPADLKATVKFGDHQGDLKLHALRGSEPVSRPFRYEIDFQGEGLDMEAAPGSRVRLLLEHRLGHERRICGACQEISILALPADAPEPRTRYRAVVVPETFLALSLRRGFRIFQEKSVVQILEQVFKDAGLKPELLDKGTLSGSYSARTYCVQYDESEWDFLCRLLEEEGILFSFRHGADGEVMQLEDQSDQADQLESLAFNAEPQTPSGGVGVWDVHAKVQLHPAEARLCDYDPLHPNRDLSTCATSSAPIKRGFYEYPGRYEDPKVGARLAQVRLDSLHGPKRTIEGRSNAIFLESGRRLKIDNHPSGAAGEYFISELKLHLRIDAETDKGPLTDEGPRLFEATFDAIPSAQKFRPPRLTPRPPPPGLQTARVTGPQGAEIHTDAHGRVKVQFPWDREGKLDDHSSCWIRVSQPHTTGSILIPRVGWEVLVDFADGDPDRPVCFGKVWNPFFTPPVDLPAKKAQTHHSSASSPGGGGTNQVVMDDTAGSERVTIQAQYDILVKAANNKVLNVGKNASQTVHGQRRVQVGANEKIAVDSNQNCRFGAGQTVQVGAKRSVQVTGSATEDVAGTFELTVGATEMIQVGNPAQAVLEVIKQAAIQAAVGAAATAANRAMSAILGPVLPAINKAKQVLGAGTKLGAASSFLGGKEPNLPALKDAGGALAKVDQAMDVGSMVAGMAQLALEGGAKPADGGVPGGDGGGGGGPAGPSGATKGGSGTWASIVGGNVSEHVGGLAATNALSGMGFAVGKDSMETVGAARIELVRGGKVESTGGAKAETVGIYQLDAKESLAISAKAAAENVAGVLKQSIKGSHSMTAKGPVRVMAPQLKLKGSGTITLTCGETKVVITSEGVFVEGDGKLIIKGTSEIQLKENALGF